jgi:hypothetical protein
MNVFEQGPYDQDAPLEWVRCLLCNEVVERDWFDAHECEIQGWEPV